MTTLRFFGIFKDKYHNKDDNKDKDHKMDSLCITSPFFLSKFRMHYGYCISLSSEPEIFQT